MISMNNILFYVYGLMNVTEGQHTLFQTPKVMDTWCLLKWWARRRFAVLHISLRPLVLAVQARNLFRPAVGYCLGRARWVFPRSVIHGEF